MIRLCPLADLPAPTARGFALADISLVVVHIDATLAVYRNSCPHLGVELNWLPDQFLDVDQRLLQCAMHGALFRPADGHCLYGPCRGAALTAVPWRLVDGWLEVAPPPSDAAPCNTERRRDSDR